MNETQEITTQEQETQQAPQEQPARMKPQQGIGELMRQGWHKAVAKIVVFLLIIAYLGGLVYAEAHGFNMLRAGLAPDLLMWGYVGMVTLGILAIALPLALHYWAFDPLQRIVTLLFYGIDLGLLGINAFTDFGTNTGATLVPWAQFYKSYVMPSTPVIASLMATTLLLLDPSARALVMRYTLRAAIMRAQADQIMDAANDPAVMATVQQAAQQEVEQSLTELFGYPVQPVTGYVMATQPQPRRGIVNRFFDWFSERVMPLMVSGTHGQPLPSPSDEPTQDQHPQA